MPEFLIFRPNYKDDFSNGNYIERIEMPNGNLTIAVGAGSVPNWKIPSR